MRLLKAHRTCAKIAFESSKIFFVHMIHLRRCCVRRSLVRHRSARRITRAENVSLRMARQICLHQNIQTFARSFITYDI